MAKKKQFESIYSGYIYEKPVTYWTPTADVKRQLTKVDLTQNEEIQVGGLPIISDGKTAYIDTADAHTAIIATSGMKKSICCFMPLIRTLAQSGKDVPENMLITDPKGELYSRTAGYLKSRGYQIFCLDFRTMDKDCFNILDYPASVYRAGDKNRGMSILSDIVNALAEPQRQNCKDKFWPDSAAAWSQATGDIMLDAYRREHINVLNWSNFNTRKSANLIESILLPQMPNNTTKEALEQCCSSAENTFRSILITASSFLSMFNQNPKLAAMLSKSSFALEDLLHPKTALFLVTDDTTSTADPIIGIILNQIQSFLINAAFHSHDGKLPCRVSFILDEFASLPLGNDMDKALATHRSRGIKYYLCIQSLALLEKRYGKPELILSNCASILYLGSTELALLTELEAKLGKTTITPDGSEKPLCSRAELMTLEKTWTHKEAIYMNLQENIRYCTKLPAIEAYGMGDGPVLTYSKKPPDVQVYTVSQFVSDITEEKIRAPFAEKPKRKTAPKDKRNKKNPVQTSNIGGTLDTSLEEELAKKFDLLFGPLDDDD